MVKNKEDSFCPTRNSRMSNYIIQMFIEVSKELYKGTVCAVRSENENASALRTILQQNPNYQSIISIEIFGSKKTA